MESYTKINTDDYYRMRRRIDWIEANHLIIVRDVGSACKWLCGAKDQDSAFITQHEGTRKMLDKMKDMEERLEEAEKIAGKSAATASEMAAAVILAHSIMKGLDKDRSWIRKRLFTLPRIKSWLKQFSHLTRTGDPT